MNVLVCGGAGYIGSHICVELLNADYNVIVIDDFSKFNFEPLMPWADEIPDNIKKK